MSNQSESNPVSEEASVSQNRINARFQTGIDSFKSEDPESPTPDDHLADTETSDKVIAIIYGRVSSKEQADQGNSIQTQQEGNRKAVQAHDADVVIAIEDAGQSGQTLNRPGIREICETIDKNDVDYIAVDHISRLGRCAPETINLIQEIRVEAGVKLIVSGKVLDITKSRDKMELVTTALLADMETDYQSRKATESLEDNFLNENNWRSAFKLIPFGYREREDGWIEPVEELIPVVQDIHEMFNDVTIAAPYAEIRDVVNEKYSERLETKFDSDQIKRILKRPVYAGRPARGYKMNVGLSEKHCAINKDESLQMIDLETFRNSRDKLQEVSQLHSQSDGKMDAENLAKQFGVDAVSSTVDCVAVICKECGERMVKNGTKEDDGLTKQIYVCPNEHSRIVPHVGELNELEGTVDPRMN